MHSCRFSQRHLVKEMRKGRQCLCPIIYFSQQTLIPTMVVVVVVSGGGGSVFFSEESKFREVKQLTCGHIAQWQNKDLILLLCKICHDL